jgi:hypothetical protein
MIQRMFIIILALMLIAACNQSEAPPIDDIVGDLDTNPLVYSISLGIQWVSPNPQGRWSEVGREVQATDNITTRIIIRLEPKAELGQDFELAMASLTAEDVTIEATDSGIVYIRTTSEISDYVIYRDFPNYIVVLSLVDALTDTVEPEYIADWERIALEGNLLILQ